MVILIILATVTISATLGDNGLIKQAEKTKDIATNSIAKENEDLNQLEQEYANMMADDGDVPEPPTDTTPPIVNIQVGEVTEDSIAVTVNAVDDESGLAESGTYKYYLNGAEIATSESNTYTFTGLTEGTEYTIKVEAFDKANNKGESSVTVSTKSKSIESILKEGDYVNYVDAKGQTRKCVVLYDNASDYGIQIITMECVEDLTLGEYAIHNTTKFNENRVLYNNVINHLNNATQKYLNATFAKSVRCVGSVPDDRSYDGAGMFNSSYGYMKSYNGTLKDTDNNYQADYNQMKARNIHDIDKSYWLASRSVSSQYRYSDFAVRDVVSDGNLGVYVLCYVDAEGGPSAYSNSNGLRPVFTLKSGIKVTGGNGTPEHPYELGV